MLPESPTRLSFERRGPGGQVFWVTLTNPEMRNALDDGMQRELIETMRAVAADDTIHCVVLRGEGKVFCSGGDIGIFEGMTPERGHWFSVHRGEALQAAVLNLGKPLIAAVDGWCLAGGCELALMSDFVYASEQTRFGVTEIHIGLLPGWGGMTRLPQAVGLRRAREMLYRGEIVDAAEALRIGLANRLFPSAAELYEAVDRCSQEIAEKSRAAVRAAREITALVSGRDDAAAMALERGVMTHLIATADVREGVAAFLEKRTPRFNRTE